jgi:hypothetical protein
LGGTARPWSACFTLFPHDQFVAQRPVPDLALHGFFVIPLLESMEE